MAFITEPTVNQSRGETNLFAFEILRVTAHSSFLTSLRQAAAHPVEEPSAVHSQLDWRRVRAAIVTVLRNANQQGDTLLSEQEALAGVDLSQPCEVSSDWIIGNPKNIESEIARFELKPDDTSNTVQCLQLSDVLKREQQLSRILHKRAEAAVDTTKENWSDLLRESIKDQGVSVDFAQQRYADALSEQSKEHWKLSLPGNLACW